MMACMRGGLGQKGMVVATVVAISSFVMRGTVGLRPIIFALERRGHTVIAVPTVVLPWHPGFGPATRTVPEELPTQLEELATSVKPDGILTGYFATADDVVAAGRFIDAMQVDGPVLVDPVSADEGGPYVPQPVREALLRELVPRANVLTPNAAEAELYAGPEGPAALAPVVCVTSAEKTKRAITTELTAGNERMSFRHDRAAVAPHGTGDLTAALLMAGILEQASFEVAVMDALAATLAVVEASSGPDLALAEAQQALVAPPRERIFTWR